MHILHSIDTTGPGGAESVLLQLIKNVNRPEFEPLVILKGRGWVYDQVEQLGIEPILIPMDGSWNVRYLLRLIWFIKRNKIRLVHSHLLGSNLYCSLAGRICRVPVISTFHGFADVSEADRYLKLKLKIINSASYKIVFVSDHLRNYFASAFSLDEQKLGTIYNGVDLSCKTVGSKKDMLRPGFGFNVGDTVIGAIGNVRKAKGYEYLLAAAADVIGTYPECRFIIVGEGAGKIYDDLLALRSKLRLEKNVFFLGYRSDIAEILCSMDIFVSPSISEGFSMATVEAMGTGLPVIATRSGGLQEIVTDGQDGILVRPEDSKGLAMAICEVLSNKEKASRLSLEARKTSKRFSVKRMIDNYAVLYRGTLK